MSGDDLVEIKFTIEHETAGAYLIEHEKTVWLPKSQIHDTEKDEKTGVVTCKIPEWLYEAHDEIF